MQVKASTQSRAWKRGSDKKIAKELGVSCCLTKMVGSLHLEACSRPDMALLTALYEHVFSYAETYGKIIIQDENGKEVFKYWNEKKTSEDAA